MWIRDKRGTFLGSDLILSMLQTLCLMMQSHVSFPKKKKCRILKWDSSFRSLFFQSLLKNLASTWSPHSSPWRKISCVNILLTGIENNVEGFVVKEKSLPLLLIDVDPFLLL